jgi:hypothetical protein
VSHPINPVKNAEDDQTGFAILILDLRRSERFWHEGFLLPSPLNHMADGTAIVIKASFSV